MVFKSKMPSLLDLSKKFNLPSLFVPIVISFKGILKKNLNSNSSLRFE